MVTSVPQPFTASWVLSSFKETLSRRNGKISLNTFSRYIAKCHKIYNLIELKDSTKQNKSSSLEIKCTFARIKVDLLWGGQEIKLATLVKFGLF